MPVNLSSNVPDELGVSKARDWLRLSGPRIGRGPSTVMRRLAGPLLVRGSGLSPRSLIR